MGISESIKGLEKRNGLSSDCQLDKMIVMALILEGREHPCDRCNHDRDVCGGYPRKNGFGVRNWPNGQEGDEMENQARGKDWEPRITPAALSALADGNMENFMAAATPGGIEAQEAQGQKDLVSAGDKLPKRIQGDGRDQDDSILGILGITIVGEADDIFNYVKLPDGWTIRPTEHSMHSELVDNQGRVRAGIFYKAAFYDRHADMQFFCRYHKTICRPKERDAEDKDYQIMDRATGEVLFSVHCESGWGEDESTAADKWAEQHYPDWKNPTAYWDDDGVTK